MKKFLIAVLVVFVSGTFFLSCGDDDGGEEILKNLNDKPVNPASTDKDMDKDGIPDWKDLDIDGDGIPNDEDDDVDGDGILNETDTDDDGDGIPDGQDPSPKGPTKDDIDGDGKKNDEDDDVDGDGIPNKDDPDIDGDGKKNGDDDEPNGHIPGYTPAKNIKITPKSVNVDKNGTELFRVEITAEGDTLGTVEWSVIGNKDSSTDISQSGLLTVAENESAHTLIVKASAGSDYAIAIVNVKTNEAGPKDTWHGAQFGDSRISGLAYGNGVWIIGNYAGTMARSGDGGTSWETIPNVVPPPPLEAGGNYEIHSAAYGNDTFVFAGARVTNQAAITTAKEAANTAYNAWMANKTDANLSAYHTYSEAIPEETYSGIILYSKDDGSTWTTLSETPIQDSNVQRVRFLNGKFFVIGSKSSIGYSEDGINWTTVTLSADSGTCLFSDITYGNDKYIIVGAGVGDSEGNNVLISNNGSIWEKTPRKNMKNADDSTFFYNNVAWSIAYGNGLFVMGSTTKDGGLAWSSDGENWTPLSDKYTAPLEPNLSGDSGYEYDTFGKDNGVYDIIYSAGKFIAVGGGVSSNKIAYSTDGKLWDATSDLDGIFLNNFIGDIYYGGGKYVAVGAGGKLAAGW